MALIIWGSITVLFYFLSFVLYSSKRVRYRISNDSKRVNPCNIYRIWFWIMEIMLVPCLFNISWPATCDFWTDREAIQDQITTCEDDGIYVYYGMKALKVLAFLFAVGYNMYLWKIINKNKINSQYHEEAIQKKEVEFVH